MVLSREMTITVTVQVVTDGTEAGLTDSLGKLADSVGT